MGAESLRELVSRYDAEADLADARTPPADFYLSPEIHELESRTVFSSSWQALARAGQLERPGSFVTGEVAGEPVLAVRDGDGRLRAFFNVCRHHAAPVVAEACGAAAGALRCPYHGWSYGLDGSLKGTPEFEGVRGFERAANGLLPIALAEWQGLVFVRLAPEGPSLAEFLGGLAERVAPLAIERLAFFERRSYELECNWKVYVDNYLDGGYHVPHLHKGLNSVLRYADYTIENGERFCLQSSPVKSEGAQSGVAEVRGGSRAHYFWLFPNFMINVYEGVMDTNLVVPLGPSRTRVVFDFFFADTGEQASERNRRSVLVSERIQAEDVAICEAVQRGLASRAYDTGRLSVRREAGEHLFHRLLAAALRSGL